MTPNDLLSQLKTIGFLYSMWYSNRPNMRSVQVSMLEISCLQGFHNLPLLTPNDLWPPPKTIGFLYSMWYTYITNMRSVRASLLEISCLQCFYNVFTIWPLLTPNDLWPPPKTIGFLFSMWHSYIPNMRSVRASLLEISCLQAGVATHTHTYTHTYTHTPSWMQRLRLSSKPKKQMKTKPFILRQQPWNTVCIYYVYSLFRAWHIHLCTNMYKASVCQQGMLSTQLTIWRIGHKVCLLNFCLTTDALKIIPSNSYDLITVI